MDHKYDPARDGGFSSSSDEDSDDSSEEDEAVEDTLQRTSEANEDAEVPLGEVSSRIAVVNLDWDNVRAGDLFAVANSFVPSEGRVLNVGVYPSEFGKDRMEREEFEGPPKEVFAIGTKKRPLEDSSEHDSESEDDQIKKSLLSEDKGEEFNSTALRTYQLERLQYFYAVISCDSAHTAKALYDSMDGREYLSSANFFDLRFIPEDVSFEGDKPRDQCKELPDGYKPNEFVTDALTHSKVKLTWDADDNTRKEVQKRAFSRAEVDENDMLAYIGSGSSSESEAEADGTSVAKSATVESTNKDSSSKSSGRSKAAAIRAALGLSATPSRKSKRKEDDAVGEMQVTFSSGLTANVKPKSTFENGSEETTMEKYIRKEKERKARRKDKSNTSRDGAAAAEVGDNAEAGHAKVSDNDDPFDDPFFDDPETSAKASKKARKEEKRRAQKERRAVDAAAGSERPNLELLMLDDDAENQQIRHFNMKDVERAEKARRQKGKKGRRAREEAGGVAAEVQEGFQVDVTDPRFARIFDNHEFAIDPTHPRFKGTQGMKALLEEGRKKRKKIRGDIDEAPHGKESPTKRKKHANDDASLAGEDLQKLVQRVKGKREKT